MKFPNASELLNPQEEEYWRSYKDKLGKRVDMSRCAVMMRSCKFSTVQRSAEREMNRGSSRKSIHQIFRFVSHSLRRWSVYCQRQVSASCISMAIGWGIHLSLAAIVWYMLYKKFKIINGTITILGGVVNENSSPSWKQSKKLV